MTVAKAHAHEGAWLREERIAPLAGLGVPVLGLAGLIVLEGPANRPEIDVAPREFITYFDKGGSVVFGSFLVMLSVVFFLWFLGSLRAVLREAEGGAGRLSAIAFGGGLATAVLWSAIPGVSVLGAMTVDHLNPQAAKTIFVLGDAFIYPAAVTAAVLVAATGLVVLRTGALPRWLGWLSLALALWLLVPPLGSAAGTPENPAAWNDFTAIVAVPIWTAIVGVVLARARLRAA